MEIKKETTVTLKLSLEEFKVINDIMKIVYEGERQVLLSVFHREPLDVVINFIDLAALKGIK